MAGEAALIAAQSPDYDLHTRTSSATYDINDTYQLRARNVAARVMGGIISPINVDPDDDVLLLDSSGNEIPQTARIEGCPFKASVAYHVDDLFFPGILGFSSLTLGATAPGTFIHSSVLADGTDCQ